MSFFNKIWKNIRDKKESNSSSQHQNQECGSTISGTSTNGSKSNQLKAASAHHHPLGQKGKTFYKRIDELINQQQEESESNQENQKKRSEEKSSTESTERIEVDVENVAPNTVQSIVTGDDGHQDDELIQLPPGIVAEMAKSKNQVSRHVSVSRSGRYKQKHRKRSNLFDVVTNCDHPDADGTDKKEKMMTTDVVATNDDWSVMSKKPHPVTVTSFCPLSPDFDSNFDHQNLLFKSIEQKDVSQTVIEVEVMTTSQSLLSSCPPPLPSSLPPIIGGQSKEGVTINPSFITFGGPKAKMDVTNQNQLKFNFNNNSNHFLRSHESIKL